MKYFYIILRDGFMHEIPFTQESYAGAFSQWQNKGIIATVPKGREMPIGINSVDIAQILDHMAYNSYVRNKKPKEYIRDGVWYDGKENKPIRYEEWKQLENRKTQLLESKKKEEEPMGAEERAKKVAEIRRRLVLQKVI